MSQVTYLTGTWTEFIDILNNWYFNNEDSKTMVYTFEQKELMYKWLEEDIADLPISGNTYKKLEDEIDVDKAYDIQKQFMQPEYEDDVVISMKVVSENPTNPNMIKWDPKFVEDQYYHYIIATRVSIDF